MKRQVGNLSNIFCSCLVHSYQPLCHYDTFSMPSGLKHPLSSISILL